MVHHARMANFLSEGFQELGRKLDRSRLGRAMRQQDSDRSVALTALGQGASDEKVDLGAYPAHRDRLSALDARAGELSQESARLESEKAALDKRRRTELEAFATRRKVVEAVKSPIDVALREARTHRSATEQLVKQSEARIAAIAGKIAGLDRDITTHSSAPGPEAQQKAATAQAERTKLSAEQDNLQPTLVAARGDLPAHAAEEARLAGESQKHAAQIAVIDAEQKAAIGRVDAELTRVRGATQAATQQSGAVGKDRGAALLALGTALYEGKVAPPVLTEPTERVAAIDRQRAQSESEREASLARTRELPGGTMAKFWAVAIGVPVVLAALGTAGYQYQQRKAPVAAVRQPMATEPVKAAGECDPRPPPENGIGIAVRPNCVRHEGTFVKGVLESGKITYADGRVAEGTFVGGHQLGKGTLTWRDGRRYEGMFVEGRSWGPGVFVLADGTRLTGTFQPGVRLVGIGLRQAPDGSVTVGEYAEGKPTATMFSVKGDNVEPVEPAKPPPAPSTNTGKVEVVQ